METEIVPNEAIVEELKHSYQPTDENGVNMGGVQVIPYRTTEELIQKLQDNNIRLQRKLREANRKNKTGQFDREEIPETAPKFVEPVEFKPQTLSADELIEISRDMVDPSKVESAYARLTQATFGAPVEKVRSALTQSQQSANEAKIAREVDNFLVNNPDYYVCQENFNTICNWMSRYNLEPNEENFTMAYKRLSAADILLVSGGTIPRQSHTPVVQPVVVQEGPDIVVVEQPQATGFVETINFEPSVSPVPAPPVAPVQRVSTQLNNGNSSSATPPLPSLGSDIKYVSPAVYDSKGRLTNPPREFVGLKALDAIPVEEYRRRLNTEPGFKEKVDKLLANRPVNRNQR